MAGNTTHLRLTLSLFVGNPAAVSTRLPPLGMSVYFDGELLSRGVGIRFKGEKRTNVEEYSISEGWIKVQAGKARDRKGNPLLLKLSGPVEAWYEDLGEDAPVAKA